MVMVGGDFNRVGSHFNGEGLQWGSAHGVGGLHCTRGACMQCVCVCVTCAVCAGTACFTCVCKRVSCVCSDGGKCDDWELEQQEEERGESRGGKNGVNGEE